MYQTAAEATSVADHPTFGIEGGSCQLSHPHGLTWKALNATCSSQAHNTLLQQDNACVDSVKVAFTAQPATSANRMASF
jgi:hypothetical protein